MKTQVREAFRQRIVAKEKQSCSRKAAAVIAAAFFILSGIPAPASFAVAVERSIPFVVQPQNVVTLDQSNAKAVAAPLPIPSGSAIQNPSALSVSAYDPSKNTVLPNLPAVGSGVGGAGLPSGTVQVSQSSSRNVLVQYNNLSSGDFAFVFFSTGYFSNGQFMGQPTDMSSGFTVGLNGSTGRRVKLELKDVNGGVASFDLTLSGTMKNYTISAADLNALSSQVDKARIAEVVFVMDRDRSGASGSLNIETAGLSFVPTAVPTTAPLTDLGSLQPTVAAYSSGGDPVIQNFAQSSANQFHYDYHYAAAQNQWAAAGIQFRPGSFFNAQASDLVLDVNVTGGASYYKLELDDSRGRKVTLRTNVVSGRVVVTNAMLQSAGVAGFDATSIQTVVIVVDDPRATTGHVEVTTRGLIYTPVIAPDPAQNAANLSGLPLGTAGQPQITVVYADGAAAAATGGTKAMSFTYNTGNVGWAGGGLTFDDFGTPDYETVDLSGVGSVMFELWGNVPDGKVKMEVVAADGSRDWVYLTSVTTAQGQVWKVPTADIESVDLTHVRLIYFIAEGVNQTGELHINYALAAAQVNLPSGLQAFASSSPNSAASATLNANGVSINFTNGSMAYSAEGGISYDNPSTSGAVETVDLSNLGRLVLGLQGFVHVGSSAVGNYRENSVWLTVTDSNGNSAQAVLSGISASAENVVSLDLNSLSGVDLKKVVSLKFSVDGYNVAGTWLNVRTLYQVPSGWTRAASNANFAFGTEIWNNPENRNNYTLLKVRNLVTGETQTLYTLQSPPYDYTVKDVSPDGALVYFGVRNNYSSTPEGWLRIQQMNDPSKKADMTGVPYSVVFSAAGEAEATTLTGYRNGTSVGSVYALDRNTMQFNLSRNTLVDQGTAVLDGGFLIVPETVSYSNTYQVTIYDASAGTGHLVKLNAGILYHASQGAGGSGGSGSYTMLDAYTTPEGRNLITIGISAVGNSDVDYSQTFILDPATGAQLAFGGAATAVTYSGGIAQYTVRFSNGSSGLVSVDPKTLTVVPNLPAEWTAAASNANFVFHVKDQVVGGYTVHTLQVKDLRTGKIRDVVRTRPPAIPTFSRFDVSADGNAVIYEMNGYMQVQKLSDPNTKWTGGGVPVSVETSGNLVTLTYPDGTRAWISTRTFKRVPMPLPAGWTRAASNAKFAFAVESRIGEDRNNYDVLKVQDLMTGVTQELYSLQSPPYSYTKMDVSSDGKLVSFGVRNNYGSAPEGWVRVQQVSDASKKTDITGALSGIAFKSGGDVSVTTLTSFANGTQLENAYTVKRSTMQSVLTNIKLVTKGTAVLAGGYLIIPVQNAYSNTYEVTLYDASAGGNHLVKLSAGLLYHASQAAGGSSGSGRYTMIDAYKTPSGKKLITVGISAVGNAGADYSQTFIIDPVTGVKLAINGAATAVKYSGFTALYTVRSGNGSTSRVSVNLKTLSVIG